LLMENNPVKMVSIIIQLLRFTVLEIHFVDMFIIID
jgi:hypothetical protein